MNKEQTESMQSEANQNEGNQNRQESTLDEVLMELDQILNDMEQENSLEETFQMYHKGIDLLKTCNDKIEKIEKQIQILDEEGNTHEF